MKMKEGKNLFVTAALAGILLGVTGCASNTTEETKTADTDAETTTTDESLPGQGRSDLMLDGKCWGTNTCRGKGACAGQDNSCAGKNTCKGKGWEQMDIEKCEEIGGRFEES